MFHLRIICLSLSHSLWPPSHPAVFYQFVISCHPTMRCYATSSNDPKVSIKLVTTDVCNFCLQYVLVRFSLPKQGYGSSKFTKQIIPLIPFLSLYLSLLSPCFFPPLLSLQSQAKYCSFLRYRHADRSGMQWTLYFGYSCSKGHVSA